MLRRDHSLAAPRGARGTRGSILRSIWNLLQLALPQCRSFSEADSICHQKRRPSNRPSVFSRMRSKGSRFHSGGLGVEGVFARRCVHGRNRSQPFATVTVRNRPREDHTGRGLWEILQRWSLLEVSDVSLFRFAWQAWHFVTFRTCFCKRV